MRNSDGAILPHKVSIRLGLRHFEFMRYVNFEQFFCYVRLIGSNVEKRVEIDPLLL